MTREKFAGILMVVLFVSVLAIAGCNDSDHDAAAPAALSTYAEDVAECMPQVTAAQEGVPRAEVNASIAEWGGWDPELEFSVFYKLLTEDSAEGLFSPIANADVYIEMINYLQTYWTADGTYPDVNLGIEGAVATVTVDTSVTSVTIPYFGGTQAVDRLITVEGDFDGEFICQMAFTASGGEEAVVAWSKMIENNDISVFYGRRAADGLMTLWGACYADKATVDTADDFYGVYKWIGNPDEGWFAATQYMNGAGGSKVLAGGEPDGEMAFLAIRNDDAVGPVPHYLVSTIANLTGGTAIADADILNEDDDGLPLQATRDVFKYIEVGNAACLGYLTEYPDAEADILPLIDG